MDDLEKQYSDEENQADPSQAELLQQYQSAKSAQDNQTDNKLADREAMLSQNIPQASGDVSGVPSSDVKSSAETNLYGSPLADRQAMLGQDIQSNPQQDMSKFDPSNPKADMTGAEQAPAQNPQMDIYQKLLDQLGQSDKNTDQYKNDLKAAQNKKSDNDLNTSIAMGAARLGHGIAGASEPVDTSMYKQMNKMSDEQLQAAEQQVKLSQMGDQQKFGLLKEIANQQNQNELSKYRASSEARLARSENMNEKIKEQAYDTKNQETDPDSGLSKRMGAALESAIPSLQGKTQGLSYSDMLQQTKFLEQQSGLDIKKLAVQEKAEQAKSNASMRQMFLESQAQAKQDKLDAKKETENTNRIDKAGKLIDSEVASSRSAFGKAALNNQSVQNAEALLNGEKNLDDLDPRQVVESAKVLDRILSGGSPTISGSEHLTPDTARMRAAKLMEMWTNQRQGAGAGSFLASTQKTLQREKNLALQQIASTQGKLLSPYSDLKDDPRMQKVLQAHGLTSDLFDYKQPETPKQDPQISKYAQQHNLTYDQASSIIEARKAKANGQQ